MAALLVGKQVAAKVVKWVASMDLKDSRRVVRLDEWLVSALVDWTVDERVDEWAAKLEYGK